MFWKRIKELKEQLEEIERVKLIKEEYYRNQRRTNMCNKCNPKLKVKSKESKYEIKQSIKDRLVTEEGNILAVYDHDSKLLTTTKSSWTIEEFKELVDFVNKVAEE